MAWEVGVLTALVQCLQVELPTVRMAFMVNTSAFAGNEGKYVTSRNLRDRLMRELERNLALRVEDGEAADSFIVSGRGTLHISILIENMRREGYEMAVGPPRVSTPLSPAASLLRSEMGLQRDVSRPGQCALLCLRLGICCPVLGQ